ncbi:MAG: tRNA glutamyl-Q(34) synthetase GluQRS [Atopobiaceae bacterium]|jgi:glutamyl-tRNA synthetase
MGPQLPKHPRGRFAPTPSGRMHAGNVFSCLMNWLAVRSLDGSVVLRIEDLDPRAQNRENVAHLMSDLEWLGLTWDEGPYFQSERSALYQEALHELGPYTYPCFCTRQELHAATAPHASDGTYVYPGTCRNLTKEEVASRSKLRPAAVRLRVPETADPQATYSFCDEVYGVQRSNLARDCGDFIVRRSDGVFAYQLAVVVDDALMNIDLVVRGSDLLGSVARQMYLQDLLHYKHPLYAHIPLLVSPEGRRLSKRDHDLDLGYLREVLPGPEPLLTWLASLVSFASPEEMLTANDLIEHFSWEKLRAHQGDIEVAEMKPPTTRA